MRTTLLSLLFALSVVGSSAQTYFYIDQIVVVPSSPTSQDAVSIDLVGGLSSTGAYVVNASAAIAGNTVTIAIAAADPGGLTVIVPHTETIPLGTLSAGSYSIVIDGQGVADFAPTPEHQFTVSGSGNSCDLLTIASVQWQAFADTAIVVHVLNGGSDIFDYPNFILFNANGDTLAKETVNFFGIAQESWHFLRIMPGAMIPSAPFFGTLELWRNFTTELACSWSSTFDLCPPPPCSTLMPTIQNFGGALAIGTYGWTIYDDVGQVITEGTLVMTATEQYDTDTVCLVPGHYSMSCVPFDPPTGGQPYFGVMTDGWISGPNAPVPFDVPFLLEFDFLAPCSDGANAIDAIEPDQDVVITQQGSSIHIRNSSGQILGPITVFDAQGRLLDQRSFTSSTGSIFLGERPTGIMVLRMTNAVYRLPWMPNP